MEHAVIVHLPLSGKPYGLEEEREAVFLLEDRLTDAIEGARAGELDGNEFGDGECTLYMYGPDADRLFSAVAPILRLNPLARGGYAIKRYGEVTDLDAAQVQVSL